MIEYKVKNLIEPAELSQIKLFGSVGEQMDGFLDKRVFSDFAKYTVYRECEDAFFHAVDGDGAVGYWQGEFRGKWIIGAARCARYRNDEEMKSYLRECAHGIMN